MLSPRIVQLLFTVVALSFAFTLLNRALAPDDESFGTSDDNEAFSPPRPNPYPQGASFLSHVTEKVSPWLGGGGGNSLAQHIKDNEAAYDEMKEQRKDLYKLYDLLPDPSNKDLYVYAIFQRVR